MTSLTRPRGPLPRRVYWVRRLAVLGMATLLVVGITRLLTWGGDEPVGSARVVGSSPVPDSTEDSPSARSSTRPSPWRDPVPTPTRRARLAQPTGPCDPSDVVVSPLVRDAHVAAPVRIVLLVTTMTDPACRFEASAASVIVRLRSEDRSEPLWTTQDCPLAVAATTVVARPTRPGRVVVTWDGRTSDEECSNLTDWVFPGSYVADAVAVGSSKVSQTPFILGLAVRPTVTRTPRPTTTPSASGRDASGASAPASGDRRSTTGPSASPTR